MGASLIFVRKNSELSFIIYFGCLIFLLFCSIQSLKDSNLMLQETVQTMADKLIRRDSTIEKLNSRIKQLETNIESKELEHKVTVDQLKKLALHLPQSAKKKWYWDGRKCRLAESANHKLKFCYWEQFKVWF